MKFSGLAILLTLIAWNLGCALIALKVFGAIDYSWPIVTLPIWFWPAAVIATALYCLVMGVCKVFMRRLFDVNSEDGQ